MALPAAFSTEASRTLSASEQEEECWPLCPTLLRIILGKSRCAFSGFADGHRIPYQNVFEKGCDIGPESTVPFTPEKWAPLSVSSPEKRKEFRSSSAGARQRCLKL